MGKAGRVIKSVQGIQTERFNMTYIRATEDRVVVDDEEVHNMVTAHFNEMYAMPEDAKTPNGVPEHLRREIYPALRAQTYPEANAAMIKLNQVPSLDEIRAAIASLTHELCVGLNRAYL